MSLPVWFGASNDLSGWDFSGQDLSGANFFATNLSGANFARAALINGVFGESEEEDFDAILTNADLTAADARGATGLNLTGAITNNLIRPNGRINDLNLAAGEKLVAYAGVPIPVKFGDDFSIAPTATFDLTDNPAIIDYAGTSPAATVREKILTGRGGAGLAGKWTGTGITSSTAAEANRVQPDSHSLGYADNATMPLGPYTKFHGAPVDSTSVLVTYTRTGDANLDGVVNDDDVTIVGAAYAPRVPQASWALGDFDYNGFVDDDDVTLLGAFYDPSSAPLTVTVPWDASVETVPEPATAGLLLVALGSMLFIVLRGRATLSFRQHLLCCVARNPARNRW
jgi:uncharacterized protein YjbI with pentapeptide repeats